MRVLGAARLSHDTDESTSIERQTESIEYTCKARQDTLVHVTADTDVSGAISPFERGELGPWLREPLLSQWDVLMVAKLDRLTRSLTHFDQFRQWCDEHGKTIVSVSESIDLSTSIGRMFANLLAMFAQFERERMSERRKDAADKAKRDGRYDGRKGPFGYTAGKDMRLVQDPVYAPIAAQMAAWRTSGRTYAWITRELNSGEVKPRESDTWSDDLVYKILTNPGLNGQIVKWIFPKDAPRRLTVLRGDDGTPLKFTDDPILSDSEWLALSNATERKSATPRQGGFLLSHVAFCGNCGKPLYGSRRASGHEYYRCRSLSSKSMSCGSPQIPLAELEEAVTEAFLNRWGARELYRRTVKPAVDHRSEIAVLEARLAEIESEMLSGNLSIATGGRMTLNLEKQIAELKALPVEDAGEKWEPAGISVAGYWNVLDGQDDRQHFLESIGVRAIAWRDQAGSRDIHVITQLGTPEGFEQASGLLLPHTEADHQQLFDFGGFVARQEPDGTMVILKDY